MKTLISKANVLVLDGTTAPQIALVIDDGRIAGTGSLSEMSRLAGPAERRRDVHGATVMPGIIDTHPLDNGFLEPKLYYSYTSKVYNDPENTPLLVQPACGLLSALLTWRDAWSVTLEGRNLTNETYIVDGVNDVGNGIIDGTFGMPRTWSVSLRRKF